ncbi:RDD family protein [Vineibacter terrae]|nr:RDD family protein [Vineibacter terrae]
MANQYPSPPPPPPPPPGYPGGPASGYPNPPGYSPYGQAPMQGPVYAGFWLRFVAYIIDAIVVNIAAYILGFIVGLAIGFGGGRDAQAMQLVMGILGIVLAWLYFALQESSAASATLGKRALGLRVLCSDGARLSFGRATGRFFAKIISGIILMIGYIMAAFTDRKRALHDMIADTVVIKG